MPDPRSVVVIGGGTAGSACARRLARAGWTVTVVERDRLGGTCLWRGCIPKKALYQTASAMRSIGQAEQFGVIPGGAQLDWQGALAWKWHSEESYAGDQRAILEEAGATVVTGDARFVAENAIEVSGQRIEADHFVISTGSVPVMPPIPGIEFADTSDTMLRLPEVPATLTIVGGGFIAMEMAGIFASLGSKITVVTRGARILDMLDPELAEVAVRRLGQLGVEFVTSARVTAIAQQQSDVSCTFETAEGTRSLASQRLLMAVGRRPAIDDLDLTAAGVQTDENGHLVLDQFLRTTNPAIYACGDAAGGMMQTPIANLEGRAVADSLESGHPVHPDCSCIPIACFTLPQLATVGLTEGQASESGTQVEVRRTSFSSVGAMIIADDTDGFVKIVVEHGSGKILGCQIASSTASDLVYAVAVAMKGGLTDKQLGDVPAIHPSFVEAVYFAG